MIEVTVEISPTINVGSTSEIAGFTYDSEITGYITDGNVSVANGDTLREIIQKLQGQIDYLKANTFGL